MEVSKYLVTLALITLIGCAQTGYKTASYTKTSSVDFDVTTEGSMKEYYDKKLVGKLTIWTNENFYNSTQVNEKDLERVADIYIKYGSGSSKFAARISEKSNLTIYLPKGNALITTNAHSTLRNDFEVFISGGEEINYFWEKPESIIQLTDKKAPTNFNKYQISYLSTPKLSAIYYPDVEFQKENIGKDQILFTIIDKGRNGDNKVWLNGELLKYKKLMEVKRNMKFGDNYFEFIVENSLGFKTIHKFNQNRQTYEEQKYAEKIQALEKKRVANEEKEYKATLEKVVREGDGSNEDKLCQRYGLKPQTNGYAECRMRLDFAKAESIKQQQQYEREQAAYEQQLAAIEKEKERRRGAAFMELGARMMSGQRTLDAINSVGTGAPIAPRKPTSFDHTITLPNGRMINCTTMGTMTNCF